MQNPNSFGVCRLEKSAFFLMELNVRVCVFVVYPNKRICLWSTLQEDLSTFVYLWFDIYIYICVLRTRTSRVQKWNCLQYDNCFATRLYTPETTKKIKKTKRFCMYQKKKYIYTAHLYASY